MENETLQQACVVPFRRSADGVEFCLITSLKKQLWIVPKGIVDPGETTEEAGLREAHEEAGIRGRVVGEPLGAFEDSKWGARLEVTALLMEVDRCDETWPEDDARSRRWASGPEALSLIPKKPLREMLRRAISRLSITPTPRLESRREPGA